MDELDPTFKPEFQKPDAADEIFFHARKIQGLEEEVLHPKRTTGPCEHLEMNGQVPLQSETELHGQRKVGELIETQPARPVRHTARGNEREANRHLSLSNT